MAKAGEGITVAQPEVKNNITGNTIIEKSATVTISGKSSNQVYDISDNNRIHYGPADILAHELVGHAIAFILGDHPTGNAVKTENIMRSELAPDHPQRFESKDHVEY